MSPAPPPPLFLFARNDQSVGLTKSVHRGNRKRLAYRQPDALTRPKSFVVRWRCLQHLLPRQTKLAPSHGPILT